jgi:toxin HigB-1
MKGAIATQLGIRSRIRSGRERGLHSGPGSIRPTSTSTDARSGGFRTCEAACAASSGRTTRKLAQLEAAATPEFLRSPPGNRLEALKGDRQGQHSTRVNDQWRICFRSTAAGPEDVEIADYH